MTTTLTPSAQRRRSRLRGAVVSAVATLLLTPVHAFVVAAGLLAAGRYDSSGRGGPFRSCTADSVSCAGPHYGMIAGAALVLLALAWVLVGLGVRSGYPAGWRSRLVLTALNAGVAAGGAVAFWWLLRG